MKKRINILLVALFIFANMAILSYAQEANTTATGTETKGAQGPGGTASEVVKPKEHSKGKGKGHHKKGMHRKGNKDKKQGNKDSKENKDNKENKQ